MRRVPARSDAGVDQTSELRNAFRRLAKPADKCPDRVPRRLPDLRPQNIKRPDVRDRRARVGAAEDSKRPRRPRKVPRQARVEMSHAS